MTVIIHPVGDGDLGIDILSLSREEKQRRRDESRKHLGELIDAGCAETVADALLTTSAPGGIADSRFRHTPISLILQALKNDGGIEGPVRLLLLGSETGMEGSKSDETSLILKKAFDMKPVRDLLEERYGFDLTVESIQHGNLCERECFQALGQWMEDVADDELIVVNGISGATMMVLSALGLVDQRSFDWRLAVVSDGGESASFIFRETHEDATFYWLRSLGFVEQAKELIDHRGETLADGRIIEVVGALEEFRDSPRKVTDGHLATIVAVDMMRAGNGAGLLVRPWIEKHYKALLDAENKKRKAAGLSELESLIKEGDSGLGPAIGRACKSDLLNESESTRWLSAQGEFNKVGNFAVHESAAPSAKQIVYIRNVPELAAEAPPWMPWPGDGRVLYIYGCGTGRRYPTILQRVLQNRPEQELKRAVPGALLEGADPLDVEFLILHSSADASKRVAAENIDSIQMISRAGVWKPSQFCSVDMIDYGGGDPNEIASATDVMKAVGDEVFRALENKSPAAVVVVGTGQKAAVYGALRRAQGWCAKHAVPLFLQTFVDPGCGIHTPEPQFHRIALPDEAETALRKCASIALRSLDMLSAVRVLSAGDHDMDVLADKADRLREEYQKAVKGKNLDEKAGVVVDVIRAIRWLWYKNDDDWLARTRLVVVAAETLDKGGNGKLNSLLQELPDRCRSNNKGRNLEFLKVDELGRGDLVRLPYEVRNGLAVTHGDKSVSDALDAVLNDFKLKPPAEDFSFGGLLDVLIERIEEDAPRFNSMSLNSDWFKRFKSLLDEVEQNGRA